ncbi:WD-40 repeat protein [Reticulomyxa filosa]|uniref:WD-40 repeat protein n=1 Tax=Reticulomyxa filosa TaxID=46433 RepID=X6NKL3_RETFI|nr:WD-40 repeat protein [Reticulomyxa filosa]|eukprot:ETO26531.1 WD-40 repeat protein [Reticulomyxa filosa]
MFTNNIHYFFIDLSHLQNLRSDLVHYNICTSILKAIITAFLLIEIFLIYIFFFAKYNKITTNFQNKIMAQEKITLDNKKTISTQLPLVRFIPSFQKVDFLQLVIVFVVREGDTQIIIEYWIRILRIKLGWIHEFDKLVVNYVMIYLFLATTFFMLDAFRSSSKSIKIFTENFCVNSIDYSTFDGDQYICSGSENKTVSVWEVETDKQIRLFNEHSCAVSCVKFSQYHHHRHCRNVVCSSSRDKTIRFWDIKHNQQLQMFKGHTKDVYGIEFSPFNCGRYLCSGSYDNTIRLWDVETSKTLHVFNGHERGVLCVDFSPLQSNKSNCIGLIGGNGYAICSGSFDTTIRIWDVEKTKQLIVFKGHRFAAISVKYESNESRISSGANTILSGSYDCSIRMWDIRSGQQIQMFNGHTNDVNAVEYSPFVANNIEVGDISNVICSGSSDNTIRFWDIRSNKNELYVIKGDRKEDGIKSFKFLQLNRKEKKIAKNFKIIFHLSPSKAFYIKNRNNLFYFSKITKIIKFFKIQKMILKFKFHSNDNELYCCFNIPYTNDFITYLVSMIFFQLKNGYLLYASVLKKYLQIIQMQSKNLLQEKYQKTPSKHLFKIVKVFLAR